jgi:SSS family solute:Na+ symporter
MMMNQLFGPTMLGVGLTALVASLMSGLAANVSGFASVWTEDIYRAHLHTGQTETHYRTMGRAATIVAIGISVLASSLSFYFSNLMEHVQLIFSVFNAPFFAIFLVGMGERRITARGAFAGFLSGTGIALLHLLAVARHWIHYGSTMNSNFHAAIYAFCTTLLIGGLVSATDRSQTAIQQHTGLIFRWKMWPPVAGDRLLWALSFILLATCLALNVIWR